MTRRCDSVAPKGESTDHTAPNGLARRTLLKTGALLAAASVATGARASDAPADQPAQAGDRLMIIKGKMKNTLLTQDMLELGKRPKEAFPFDPATETLRKGEEQALGFYYWLAAGTTNSQTTPANQTVKQPPGGKRQ